MRRVNSHAEYVEYDMRMKFQASGAPDSPWMQVESGDGIWPLLGQLVRKLRSSSDILHIGDFYSVARAELPTLTSLPMTGTLIEKLLARGGNLEAHTCELIALLFIATNANPEMLNGFVPRVPDTLRRRCRAWAVDIGENRASRVEIDAVLTAFNQHIAPIDRIEVEVAALRLIDSPSAARAAAKKLRNEIDRLSDREVAIEPGSDHHRLVLLELRLLLEVAYRHLEEDEPQQAVTLSEQAYNLASGRGLPSSDLACAHDLAGFDLIAQVAAANWIVAANLASVAVGNQVLFSGVEGTPLNTAHQALQRVRHGRFPTEYDGLADAIDHASDQAWSGNTASLIDDLDGYASRSRFIRCRLLWSISLKRLAKLQLQVARELQQPEKGEEAALTAIRCGDIDLVRGAAEHLLSASRPAGHLIASAAGTQRSTRVARLILLQALAPTLDDRDLPPYVDLALGELAGPFNMDPQLDVQRAAIKTSGVLITECSGLASAQLAARLEDSILDAWDVLAGSKEANALTLDEIAKAARRVLISVQGSESWSSGRTPLKLLAIAQRVTERMGQAGHAPWVDLVKPAVEFILAGDAPKRVLSQTRELSLQLIPKVDAPKGDALPVQTELLAMHYRAELGEPPSREVVRDLVANVSTYLRGFLERPDQPGWRWPLRADLVLLLAKYGDKDDLPRFLATLVELVLSETALLDATNEAADALNAWLLRHPSEAERDQRREVLLAAHPTIAGDLLTAIEADEPLPRRPKSHFGSGRSVTATLLPLAAELVRILDSGRRAPLFARLLAVLECAVHHADKIAALVARNQACALLTDPAIPDATRSRFVVLFISSQYLGEEEARYASSGLRYALSRQPREPLSGELRNLLREQLVDRIQRGPPPLRREAAFTLRTLLEHGGKPTGGAFRFSEADERAWRRVRPHVAEKRK